MKQITINNPIEKDINRNELVLNQNAGSLIFTNTTGNQRVQLTGKDGGNIYINNKVVSTFAPNNCQSLTKGDKFDTTFSKSAISFTKPEVLASSTVISFPDKIKRFAKPLPMQ